MNTYRHRKMKIAVNIARIYGSLLLLCSSHAWAAEVCTSPTQRSVEESTKFLAAMQSIYDVSSLLPMPFQSETGFKLKYAPDLSLSAPEISQRRLQFLFIKGIPGMYLDNLLWASRPIGETYEVSWGYTNVGAEVRIHFRLNESAVCVTEEDLIKKFGNQFVRSQGSMRHLLPNQPWPEGLRPRQDALTFTSTHGIMMGYQFDCTCATGVRFIEAHAADWQPSQDELGHDTVLQGAQHDKAASRPTK